MKFHLASLVLTVVTAAGNGVGRGAAFTSQQLRPSSSRVALSSSTSAAQQQEEKSSIFGRFLDEESLMKQSSFPITPDQLISRAREVLSPEVGIGTMDGGACLADDFEFVAAVVGPISKKEYLAALTSFNLEDSFDITPNFYGFSVDPMQRKSCKLTPAMIPEISLTFCSNFLRLLQQTEFGFSTESPRIIPETFWDPLPRATKSSIHPKCNI